MLQEIIGFNSLKNYNWHYKYNESPTIMEIITFMSGKSELELSQLFDYTNSGTTITENTLKYLNLENNKIVSIESAFTNFLNLEFLKLSNKIVSLEGLL